MVPLIMKEVEDDSVIEDNSTVAGLQKMMDKIQSTGHNLDPNTLARDNYRRRQKVFRNYSHYFGRPQDTFNPL